ncbi:MAG: prepilin peptidase [Phenylobacterium sp.]|uniref:prepilin peptidase n=1 Tax=Phenylobacterium sp. TaxID=1871053 RepID=UPI003BB6A795
MTPWPLLGAAGAVGLALGSYGATAAIRFARAEGSAAGRSHCDACGASLSFAQTVPVISYLRLGGACAGCGSRIDPLHLVGEVVGASIVVLSLLVAPLLQALTLATLGLLLLTVSIIDVKIQRLPDAFTAAIAVVCGALALQASTAEALAGLGAALVSLGVLQAVRLWSRHRRGREGLGLGDVKLVSALALWLGLATPWMVVLASILGLGSVAVLRPHMGRLAFGPMICSAAFIIGLIRESGAWPMMP